MLAIAGPTLVKKLAAGRGPLAKRLHQLSNRYLPLSRRSGDSTEYDFDGGGGASSTAFAIDDDEAPASSAPATSMDGALNMGPNDLKASLIDGDDDDAPAGGSAASAADAGAAGGGMADGGADGGLAGSVYAAISHVFETLGKPMTWVLARTIPFPVPDEGWLAAPDAGGDGGDAPSWRVWTGLAMSLLCVARAALLDSPPLSHTYPVGSRLLVARARARRAVTWRCSPTPRFGRPKTPRARSA